MQERNGVKWAGVSPKCSDQRIRLMVSANSVTNSYARALLAATPPELLVAGKRPLSRMALSQEQLVRMETEMSRAAAK